MADHLKFSSTAPVTELRSGAKGTSAVAVVSRNTLMTSLDKSVVGTLALLLVLGFGLRLSNLGAMGFAEDEINKLDAILAYQRGDISANGEHPMLMKALMYVGFTVTHALQNNGMRQVADEVVLRLPNVIFGTLTVVPLFLLTAALFDRWTGLLAAAFWAFGINAIAINRVGKEDTLLVFFMLFAFYFYLRAKQTSPFRKRERTRHYILSGVSFGLMLASKYFPHYWGLNALYHHNVRVREAEPGEPSGGTPRLFYIVVFVAFLIANPAVLLPEVWNYLNAYMGERLLVHTGYLFGEHLYRNNFSASPFWGTPVYFYGLFMAIKIPLAVLVAFVVGLFISLRRWRQPGYAFVLFMFLFWIVPYSLIGAKWLRYTLSLMPFVYMLAAIGVVEIVRFVLSRWAGPRPSLLVPAAAVLLFIGAPALIAYGHGPHYALYTNALGAGSAGYYFPHDEFYDDGLREALKFVTDTAEKEAVVAHETPAVARYYLSEFNRQDLQSVTMSGSDFDPARTARPTYAILQSGRVYFENREKLSFIKSNFKKVHEVKINGLSAAEVYVNH